MITLTSTLSLNKASEMYEKIIKRITDPDILNEVIRELYAEAEINAKDSVFGSGEIPDIQELLIDLNSENLETIEYFYCLCQEEKLIPDALRRYEDEVFPYLEDSIKMTLYNEGLMYRDSSRELDTVYNDRAVPCQNSLFMLGQINI